MSYEIRVRTLLPWALVCMVVYLGAAPVVEAQDAWTWPERAENLQSLPEDFPPERLRAVMTGFSRALGVRCSHCHVGEEGQPLSTYDFPSDDNPNKVTARVMLEMLGSINDQLDKVEPTGDRRVNMWCHTCHRGRPRPMTLEETLAEVYRSQGIGAVLTRYRELREEYYGTASFDFSERALNVFGYELLGQGKTDDAVAVFRLNAEQFPQSGNVWDSLAEAYSKAGKSELAEIFYRKSLENDPNNVNALEQLRRMRASGEDGG